MAALLRHLCAVLALTLCAAAAGCGGEDDRGRDGAREAGAAGSGSTGGRTAPAPCARRAFAARLAVHPTRSRVTRHRCARGWAVTTVAAGDQRVRILWRRDRTRGWTEHARAAPGVCPGRSSLPSRVARRLCGPQEPSTRDRLRACTAEAFSHALHADVDQLRVRLLDIRCSGERAATGFAFGDCPGTEGDRRACDQPRVAYWRRGTDRWRMITYVETRSCVLVQTIEPSFPSALCGG